MPAQQNSINAARENGGPPTQRTVRAAARTSPGRRGVRCFTQGQAPQVGEASYPEMSATGQLFFPVRELGLAVLATVRDDEAGARVTAVGDHEGLADGCLGAGLLPGPAVVAVPGERSTDHDDAPGVGVDDGLVVGGVLVVLRPLGDGVVPGGDRGPSTMSTVSLAKR